MGKLTPWIIVCFIFVFGCTKGPGQLPQAHIPPAPKTQAELIEDLPQDLTEIRQTIVSQAIENLGRPYQWGGQSPDPGFDCSGLVVYTHGRAGLWVPRTARDQFSRGRPISRLALQPGDLVFFNAPEKKTGFHVGIFLGRDQFIHAPGHGRRVCVSHLSDPYFRHRFRGARSYH